MTPLEQAVHNFLVTCTALANHDPEADPNVYIVGGNHYWLPRRYSNSGLVAPKIYVEFTEHKSHDAAYRSAGYQPLTNEECINLLVKHAGYTDEQIKLLTLQTELLQ